MLCYTIVDIYHRSFRVLLLDFYCGIGICQIPHLHNLRLWSMIACACAIAFVSIVLGISIHDGRDFNRYLAKIGDPKLPPGTARSYEVLGSTASKSFDALGALATISFACKSLPHLCV